jgi:hypothetical protein
MLISELKVFDALSYQKAASGTLPRPRLCLQLLIIFSTSVPYVRGARWH